MESEKWWEGVDVECPKCGITVTLTADDPEPVRQTVPFHPPGLEPANISAPFIRCPECDGYLVVDRSSTPT